MNEYLEFGHVHQVLEEYDYSSPCYSIPHHPVVKMDRLTTKVRVVFISSAPSSTGVSLNDILHSGSKIQNDIFDILLRFRQYPFAVSADIAKMYRQVRIEETHT